MPVPVSRKIVALVGFMGCGKTSVGRLLAERLGWRFVDLDARIVGRAGASIVDIFRGHGEPVFREIEAEVLERSLGEATESDRSSVLALGSGTLTRPENFARLRRAGATLVWLDCPADDLLRRCAGVIDRPPFRDEAGFRRLYQERLPLYTQADLRVDATPDPVQVVEHILALVRLTVVKV
jgi:shikimate kinase